MDSTIRALHKNSAESVAGPLGAVLLHFLIILVLFLLSSPPRKPTESFIEVAYLGSEKPEVFGNSEDVSESMPEISPLEVCDFSSSDWADQFHSLEIPSSIRPEVIQEIVAGVLKERMGQKAHARAIRRYGGGGARGAETAVQRALQWLRRNQNADGSWGTAHKEAMTGLGVLTFLAHGETTASKKYGATVVRALRFLVARQNKKGEFVAPDSNAGTYAQAICVYAVSEAYHMTRIMELKSAMERGLQVLLDGQQSRGGFDYRFRKRHRRDTSLGSWCCQAMKAAAIAGADNVGLSAAMELAANDMKSVHLEDGGFGYLVPQGTATIGITAAAVLSLQLLGHGGDSEVQKGLDFLGGADCAWKNPPAWPMSTWYYVTQAKFHQGGAAWTAWNKQFVLPFIGNQNADGSWTSPAMNLKMRISAREDVHPVYATTFAALTLQVYYRYLPTYKPIEVEKIDQMSDDDVDIEIM